ncbi:hypothetical protein F5Y15DRAFT_80434 [Xylariaceae sp. FL0016]|nr:hypothetical protein F5Y15DRAFT_80434 [Xylariaceae sp. FL0016]
MKPLSSLFVLAAMAGPFTVAARSMHQPYRLPATLRERSTGTGPQGVLTRDDHVAADTAQGKSASITDGTSVLDGEPFSTCLDDTTATVADCQLVLGDISANNGIISVAAGFCLNWWEGGCKGLVCGRNDTFAAESAWIAATMTEDILEPCIGEGKAGVVADCEDVDSACGGYRLILRVYEGV